MMMMKKQKGFNQRKYILEIKEFKKKKDINEIINKIHDKQKSLNNEYNTIFEHRLDKLRHNALTNNHLQHYIADLNFRLYSLPKRDESFKGDELKLIQHYTEIISLLEKFQAIKGEKFLSDKKELEDRIMEQSLEEQIKELSCLGRQEKYEKYIYDKLISAQNGLVDICQKYRTQVHTCEKYEFISLKLKSEYGICLDTNKKLNEMLQKQKNIEKKLLNKLNKFSSINTNKTFNPILSGNNDKSNNKEYHKINNNNRPKSSIRLNKKATNLILNKNETNNINKSNNHYTLFLKKNNSDFNTNFTKLSINKKLTVGREYAKNLSIRQKSSLNINNSNNTTNFLSKSRITRNKSMNNIKEKSNEEKNDRKYLDIVTQYLIDIINNLREQIKLKNKFKSEEIRSVFQLKYMLGKCIEDVELDLDNEKKNKINSNKNHENILGIYEDKEKKDIINKNKKYDENMELFENQLYILTYIFDNSFNGLNNINSIFPEFRVK